MSPSVFSMSTSSGIDARFKLNRLQGQTTVSTNPGLDTYSLALSRTLGSHCKMYPSDSSYARLLLRDCPNPTSIWKIFSRVAMEEDAHEIYSQLIFQDGHHYFVDLPDSCSLFR